MISPVFTAKSPGQSKAISLYPFKWINYNSNSSTEPHFSHKNIPTRSSQSHGNT